MKPNLMTRALSGAGLFFRTCNAVTAQAENLIDLYQAVLENDPQLRAATFDHTASQEVVTQACADYRPIASFDYDDTTQNIVSSDNTVFQTGSTSFPTTTWTLTVSQPIFRYANYLRIGQAKAELRKADAELVSAQQEMMLRLSEAYLAALAPEDYS